MPTQYAGCLQSWKALPVSEVSPVPQDLEIGSTDYQNIRIYQTKRPRDRAYDNERTIRPELWESAPSNVLRRCHPCSSHRFQDQVERIATLFDAHITLMSDVSQRS